MANYVEAKINEIEDLDGKYLVLTREENILSILKHKYQSLPISNTSYRQRLNFLNSIPSGVYDTYVVEYHIYDENPFYFCNIAFIDMSDRWIHRIKSINNQLEKSC